ncbi:hypothetical protein [Xanthomonas translucens]|nr:hypothetical protein [Xanthomonas translucens]
MASSSANLSVVDTAFGAAASDGLWRMPPLPVRLGMPRCDLLR